MKNKILSFVGMRLGGCQEKDTLTAHLSPTNHPLKHRTWKVITMIILLLTMGIGSVWGACEKGSLLFSMEVTSNPATKVQISAKSGGVNGSLDLAASDYVTVTGTSAVMYNSNSSAYDAITTAGEICFKNGTKHWIEISFSCSLQAGDKIVYTTTKTNQIAFSGTAGGTKYSTVNNELTLSTSETSELIGKSSLWIWRPGNEPNIKSLRIIRPATITLDASTNGGTASVASVAGATGDLVVLPHAFKSGNKFKGWYTAATGGTRRADCYTVGSDETVIAQFEALPVSGEMFSLEMQDGLKPAAEVSLAAGGSLDLLRYALISGGAAFASNSTSSSNHMKITTDGKISFAGTAAYIKVDLDFALAEGDEIELNATSKLWISASATSAAPSSGPYVNGTNQTYTVTADDGLKNNSTIYIWRGSNATVTSITITRPAPAATHTLSSVVDPAGKGTVTLGTSTVEEGATTTATYSAIDDAYEFDEWQISGTGASIDDASANPVTVTMGTSDATITLKLKPATAKYAITYNKGTNGTGEIAAGEKSEGVAFTLSESMFTREGYLQIGWATTDGGTKAYDLGGSYTTDAAQEFFPVWAPKGTDVATFAYDSENPTTAPAGWTFSTNGYTNTSATAAYVGKFDAEGESTPKGKKNDTDGNPITTDDHIAFAKNNNGYAIYDLGYATTVSAVTGTFVFGSSNAQTGKIEYLGADGTTVKHTINVAHASGHNWGKDDVNETTVVPNVRYIKIKGNSSVWIVMQAFSVTYGDLSTKYTVNFAKGAEDATGSMDAVQYKEGATVTAPACGFERDGYTFSKWSVSGVAGTTEVLKDGTFAMPANTVTLTAQWIETSTTYDVTYVSAHGTAPDAENAASVVLAELDAEGWAHKGWTADVDVTVDAATVDAGELIANGKTAILASNVTFTAVWNQIYTVTYNANANGGTCATAEATWTVGDAQLVLPAATKDNFDFVGWYDAAVGGNKIASPYTPSASIELFAHFVPKLYEASYSNHFDGFINTASQTINVYYLEGESAPTLSSVKILGVETPAYVDNGDNVIITVNEVDYTFAVTKTAVEAYAGTGLTFGGTESYVKTGNVFSTGSKQGWVFARNHKADDGEDYSREAAGKNRIYFFLGAAQEIKLTSGVNTARPIKVYRNGVEVFSGNMPKSSDATNYITFSGANSAAMYALVSNQSSGDGAVSALEITPWVPVESIVLKEGTTEITSKEIAEGAQFTLTAEVTPADASNPNIIWESANALIASVDGGVVTGEASGGPVNIIARSQDKNTIFAACAVTVADPCTPVTIEWNVEPTDGVKGGNGSASVTTNYAAGLEVVSSDPTVASVSNDGVNITINYLKKGTTKITATVVGDGSTYCNTPVSVEKTITVAPDCPAVGNLFSLEFKNISTSYAVQKGQDNEMVEIPSSDADITGGKAFVGTTSNSTGQSIAVTDGDCKFGTSSNYYVRLEVECPLQVGDIISYTSSSDKNLNFYKDNMSGTSVASSNYKVTVATGSPLIGAEVIYIKRSNSANTIMTLSIDRPAQITLNGNGGKIGDETEVVVPAVGATKLPNARKAGDFYFVGWSTDPEGNNLVANPYTPSAATVTLYAQYDDCVTQGTVYKFEVKTLASGVYIFENGSSFPASAAMTTDNYLSTLVGGDLTASVTSSSGNYQNIYIDNSGVAGVTAFNVANGYGVLTLDLGCPLKAGDVIRYNIVSDSGKKLTLKDDNSHSVNIFGNNADEVAQIDVPADFVGATQLTLNYNGGACRIASFEVYRPNKYDVTFNMMGHGSQVAAIEGVFENHKITAPTAPTDDDYAFSGWYKENTLENEWNFAEDVVTAATTLYAKWLDKSDATLKSLKYGDEDITLENGVYEYNVDLAPYITEVPALTAVTNNPNATAVPNNAAAFDENGHATSTVVVTPEKDGAATQTYTVHFTVLPNYSRVDVTATTEWKFSKALVDNTKNATLSSTETVLANITNIKNHPVDFHSQALSVIGVRVDKSGYMQGGTIKFRTTVPGLLTVEFSNTGNAPRPYRELLVNGNPTGAKSNDQTHVTYNLIMKSGDVELTARIYDENGDPTATLANVNFFMVKFTAASDLNPAEAEASTLSGYERDVTEGRYGTICLPTAGIMAGASIYELAYYDATQEKIFMDEVLNGVMVADRPYVFLPNENVNHIGVYYLEEERTEVEAGNYRGLFGTYVDLSSENTTESPLWDNYILSANRYIHVTGSNCTLKKNRAYIKLEGEGKVPTTAPTLAPGRRRIGLGVQGEQVVTGIDNLNAGETPVKVMIDGQMYILRGEKMYDATGRLVK